MKRAPAKPRAKAASAAARKKKTGKKAVERRSGRDIRLGKFIDEYLIDGNGRRAAVAAGYSPDTARVQASQLLTQPEVQARLQARREELIKDTGITPELVLGRLHAIGTADPRELTELHRCCCRYCWGKDNLYQRTPREMAEAKAQWQHEEKVREAKQLPPGLPFNEAGGIGFNPKRDPNPSCPECFGDGVEIVVFKDTRDLSPAARLLFAGVEQTQHGLKVRMHSQTDALVNIGKHLGMFTKTVELTGKDGGPVEHSFRELLDDVEGADTGIGPATGRQ